MTARPSLQVPGAISATTVYDGHGRLTSYARSDVGTRSFIYNGRDDRVAMTSAVGTRRFVYDPDGRVMGEYGASATDVKAEFIWAQPEVADNDILFGGNDGAGGYMPLAVATPDSGGTVVLNWVHGNHLGVPIATTDATGAPATTPNDYLAPGFPGQSRTIADLYYNRYRDYDPTTGRYIQADPIGLDGGQNPYAYAGNNPMAEIDPLGLMGQGPGGGRQPPPKAPRREECPPPPPPPPVDWCGSSVSGTEFVPDGNWGLACKAHDECYGRPGAMKAACDAKLFADITAQCTLKTYGFGGYVCAIIGAFYGSVLYNGGYILLPGFPRDVYNQAQRGR